MHNRPSIQLGALKAHLRRRFPDVPVRAEHLHLQEAAAVGSYLFCRKSRSREQIQTLLPHLAVDKLDGFLRMMVDKRLIFTESDRFLSLAVPMDRGGEDLERPMA